jgi:integrase
MLRAVLVARHEEAEVWSAATVNAHLSALRGVITEAWRLGYITADERDRATDVENLTVDREPTGRDIHDDEIAAMLDPGDDPGPLEVRDTAIIACLWSTGGRRAEAAGQLIQNYNRKERAVKILGKGSRRRTGYLHPEAAVYVGQWLALVNERTGPMFRPVDQWHNIYPRHLSPGSIGLIVERRRLRAGLEPLSTHDWRRTFADVHRGPARLRRRPRHGPGAGRPPVPATTSLYDRRPERQRRDAGGRRRMPGARSH